MVVPAAVRARARARTRARRRRTRRAGCSSSATAWPSGTCAAATAARSPYRFELEVDPEAWFLEDEGYELAVFHSHPRRPPRPSRTDVENIGLWDGKPYLIYVRRDRRAAPRGASIDGRRITSFRSLTRSSTGSAATPAERAARSSTRACATASVTAEQRLRLAGDRPARSSRAGVGSVGVLDLDRARPRVAERHAAARSLDVAR